MEPPFYRIERRVYLLTQIMSHYLAMRAATCINNYNVALQYHMLISLRHQIFGIILTGFQLSRRLTMHFKLTTVLLFHGRVTGTYISERTSQVEFYHQYSAWISLNHWAISAYLLYINTKL